MRNDYNQHSRVQNRAANQGIPFLKAAIESMDLKEIAKSDPFLIADYGSATGSNSYEPVQTIVSYLHQHQPNREILVSHVDLPSTDWNKLFDLISKDRYTLSDANLQSKVFTSAVGRSFYDQVLPANSVDFGISTSAVHWLSRLPCRLSKSVFVTKATTTPEEYDQFETQAQKDWSTFLQHRAKELKSGGKLFVLAPIRKNLNEEEKEEQSDMIRIVDKFFFREVEAGTLTEEERGELTLPLFMRTAQDFQNGVPPSLSFEGSSPIFSMDATEFRKGLDIDVNEAKELSDEEKKKKNEALARGMTSFWFAVTEEYIRSKLLASGLRSLQDTNLFIERFKNELITQLSLLSTINHRKGAGFAAVVFKKN